MREDGRPHRGDVVFPAFVVTPKQSKHSFEERDRSFNTSSKALSVAKGRIGFALGLLFRPLPLLADGHRFDDFAQNVYENPSIRAPSDEAL